MRAKPRLRHTKPPWASVTGGAIETFERCLRIDFDILLSTTMPSNRASDDVDLVRPP